MQCDARGSEVTVAVGVAVIIVLAVKMGYYYSKTRNGKRAGRRAFPLFNVCARKVPGAGEDCSRCLAT